MVSLSLQMQITHTTAFFILLQHSVGPGPEFGQGRAAGGTPLGLYYKLNKINCRFVEYKAGQGADDRECGQVRTPFFRPRPWRERGPQRGPMPLRLPPPTGGGTGGGRAKRKRPPSTMAYVQPCGWRWRAGRPCITYGSTDVPGCQDPGPTAPPLAVRRSGRGRRSRAALGRLAGPLTAAARSDTPTEGGAARQRAAAGRPQRPPEGGRRGGLWR